MEEEGTVWICSVDGERRRGRDDDIGREGGQSGSIAPVGEEEEGATTLGEKEGAVRICSTGRGGGGRRHWGKKRGQSRSTAIVGEEEGAMTLGDKEGPVRICSIGGGRRGDGVGR